MLRVGEVGLVAGAAGDITGHSPTTGKQQTKFHIQCINFVTVSSSDSKRIEFRGLYWPQFHHSSTTHSLQVHTYVKMYSWIFSRGFYFCILTVELGSRKCNPQNFL